MRFVILHYHILKNAGSTIEEILDRNFGERFARIDTSDRDGRVSNSALLSFLENNPHLQAVSSHQIRHPVPAAKGFIFFDLCFLRDPLDRIRSTYDYFREKPNAGDPLSQLANELSLGEFVARAIKRMPQHVNDVQVNLLANGGCYDHIPGREDLKRAVRTMRTMSFIGVVDRFNEGIAAVQNILNPLFPNLLCDQKPVNVSGGLGSTLESRVLKLQEACEPSVYAELCRLNALDFELLREARAERDRRLQLGPVRSALSRAPAVRHSHSSAPFTCA
jgi:hypothetical protein